jgi:DNA-binding NtrC family response regulator
VSDAKDVAPILVVALDPGLRSAYESRVSAIRPVLSADPRRLRETDRFVDACAALVLLDRPGARATLDAAPLLAQLPAAHAVALVCDGVAEEDLARALAAFAPRHVAQHPVPDALLRWTLLSAAPEGAGRGARDQHRPARALLGVSSSIRRIVVEVSRIAPSRVPVLILGETGTGKEIVARAIHEQSPRAGRPFVAVNCGALPETLLEEELFGHRKGAFTGATRDRRGLLQEADGGTLFLDEVAEMSPALQVKLLRVLEGGELRPIGANRSVVVDVRIVSATHRDLEAALEEGTFREDLFYRLNVVTFYLPPLRRRRVDIPFLAQHFAEEFGREDARRITLGEDFLDALSQQDFPGNVRQLRNAVERAIALAAPGQTLTSDDLPEDSDGRPPLYAMGTLRDRIAQVEIQAIREAIDRFDGNKTRAAAGLGISRLGLRKKIKRLGLE